MTARITLKTLLLVLPIGATGPGVAEAADVGGAMSSRSVDIIAMFNATCGSGRTSAAALRQSFETQGFSADWHDDTYGYFSRDGAIASYHIYPGSWNCVVSAERAAGPDLCEALSAERADEFARLPDGTCVFNMPARGLTVLVRDVCPDASHGACTWVQSTLTADRACRAVEDVDLAMLTRGFAKAH